MSYDIIDGDASDYDDLFNQICTYEARCHVLKSSWVIKSNKNAYTIRDEIHNATKTNVHVIVTAMGNNAAASLTSGKIDYLVRNLDWKSP